MNTLLNMMINTYSIIILSVIYTHLIKKTERKDLDYQLFIAMIKSTFVMLFLDILARFDGNPGTIYSYINYTGNLMIFSLNIVLPSIWFLYVHYNIYKEEIRTRKFFYPFLLINILNVVAVIWNQFTGYYYYIDTDNIFHRGPLYSVSVSFVVILLFITFMMIVVNKKDIEDKHYRSLLFFIVPPALGIVLQIKFYGLSMILNCITLSILVIFINIQNKNMYMDHLTGVCNRKKLDIYLRDKIENCTKDKTFSAIMIDLNDFKEINDTYGHDIGDHALQTTAELLRTFTRSNDIICRFGGDEFYIILDISDKPKLEQVVNRIKYCIKNYNEAGTQLYEISFSMGYDIYDYNSKMTVKEFQSHIDILMYKDKEENRKRKLTLR